MFVTPINAEGPDIVFSHFILLILITFSLTLFHKHVIFNVSPKSTTQVIELKCMNTNLDIIFLLDNKRGHSQFVVLWV